MHTLSYHTLDAAGVHQAALQTHALWNQGLSFDHYLSRIEDAIRRMGPAMRYVGHFDENGALVASLRLLDLRAHTATSAARIAGIAAVFVDEQRRGAGHGRALVQAAVADARERGFEAALLFSDIAPEFYVRMGFVEFPALDWSADTCALPAEDALHVRPAIDAGQERLRGIYNCDADRCEFRPVRSETVWRYFRWWRAAPTDLILLDGPHETGYMNVRAEPGGLRVFEWVAPEVRSDRVWASVRGYAEARGLSRVYGWLRPGRREHWMTVTPRHDAIPMLACLSGGFVMPDGVGAAFDELDHF